MAIDRSKKQQALAAASRRFPGFELPIRRLIETDETFLEICEGLAEAEFALSRVNETPAPLRSARRSEWQDLVDRLAGEVAAALRSDASARH
jgi:hypothetical protein